MIFKDGTLSPEKTRVAVRTCPFRVSFNLSL